MQKLIPLIFLSIFYFGCASTNHEQFNRYHNNNVQEANALQRNMYDLKAMETVNKRNISDIKKEMMDKGILKKAEYERLREIRKGVIIPEKTWEYMLTQTNRIIKQRPRDDIELNDNTKILISIQKMLIDLHPSNSKFPDPEACEIFLLAISKDYFSEAEFTGEQRKRAIEDSLHFLSVECKTPSNMLEKAELQLRNFGEERKPRKQIKEQEPELKAKSGISSATAKDLPKIAVWDLSAGDVKPAYAHDLTSILVSEISKLGKYEVYSQDNVRTLAGWTAERMQLGCTDTKCLTALGQMDIAKLISGRVGKIGNRYSVSLNLFDTQNAKAENAVSEFGRSEDELIELIQIAVRKLLGEPLEVSTSAVGTLPREIKDPITGMEFIFVKGGCYEMGDTFGDGAPDEKPVHEVCVGDFFLGKYEVTQGQWKKVMGSNPSTFKDSDENPVEEVSWKDVQEFIRKLNQMSGKSYRLPTEAEWEYASRSGGRKEKWAGTNNEYELRAYAWSLDNSGNRTHPVGQMRPNGLGLYDMSGNVWEWVSDWFDIEYYRNSHKNNPPGPSGGQTKVLRGGSFAVYPWSARTAIRSGYNPAIHTLRIGFRLGVSAR